MGGHFRTHRGRGDVAQGREENGKRIKGAVTGGLQPWAAGAQAPWGFCRRIAESSPCKDKAAGALARQLLSVLGTDSQPVQPAAPLGAEAGSQLTCRSPLQAASAGQAPAPHSPAPIWTANQRSSQTDLSGNACHPRCGPFVRLCSMPPASSSWHEWEGPCEELPGLSVGRKGCHGHSHGQGEMQCILPVGEEMQRRRAGARARGAGFTDASLARLCSSGQGVCVRESVLCEPSSATRVRTVLAMARSRDFESLPSLQGPLRSWFGGSVRSVSLRRWVTLFGIQGEGKQEVTC